jgi:hypothetical protein
LQLTVTPLGKVTLVVLRTRCPWQVDTSVFDEESVAAQRSLTRGGWLVYWVGGCEGPRNRPARRAKIPAIENLPDCWIARTWSLPSCFRYR